jgi:hypothetical protein
VEEAVDGLAALPPDPPLPDPDPPLPYPDPVPGSVTEIVVLGVLQAPPGLVGTKKLVD